jgi:hypothetical protein
LPEKNITRLFVGTCCETGLFNQEEKNAVTDVDVEKCTEIPHKNIFVCQRFFFLRLLGTKSGICFAI